MYRTSVTQKIGLIVGGLLIGIILLELGLRLGGFILLSLRDRANQIRLREKGEVRIICVGESTTYCGDRSYAYPRQLGEILNEKIPGIRFTVINKGKPGCSTAYIQKKLEEWINKYEPDIVMAMMGINDTAASTKKYEQAKKAGRFFRNFRTYKLAQLLWEHSSQQLREMGIFARQRPDLTLSVSKGYLGDKYDAYDHDTEAKLQAVMRRDSKNVQACLQLGNCYIGQDRYEEAAGMFNKALQLDPGSDQAYVGLGRYFLNQQSHNATKRVCHKALEINPENDEARVVLGLSYMSKKKYGPAAENFQKALQVNASNDQAMGALGWYYYWKLKRIEEAKKIAQKALALNPANYLANVTLWCSYEKEGNYQAAVEVCQKMIEADPYSQRAYTKMGSLYQKMGKPEIAENCYKKARSLRSATYNPITAHSYNRIKEILKKRGIQLVGVQYPLRSITPLKKMLELHDDVIFVDNEAVFKEALNRSGYNKLFKDNFGGDFGHCTAEGNRLLAENIANVLWEEYLKQKLVNSAQN